MVIVLRIIIIFLIVVITPAYAQNQKLNASRHNEVYYEVQSENNILELSRKWYFKADDKLEYKDIDLNLDDWALIYSHIPWKNIPKYKNYQEIAWYRTNIKIHTANDELSLLVPFHYRGAQFYMNGKLFHESRPFNDQGVTPLIVAKPDCIIIPSKYLVSGNNVLAIRTGCLDYVGGFYGTMKIGPYKKLHKMWLMDIIWYLMLATINLFLTIFFLLLYFKRRNEKYYLHFSLLAFALGLWTLGFKGRVQWILDYQWAYIIFTYVGSIVVPIQLLDFLHSFMQLKKTILAKIFQIFYYFFVVFIAAEYMLTQQIYYFQRFLYESFIFSCAIVFTYGLILSIQAIRLKRKYSRRICLGMSILTLAFLFSTFSFLDIFTFEPLLIEGFFVMTLVFASVLASRFAQVHTDLEKAHGDLLVLDKMKDEFMATTSHELRTPLHGIIGISESLMEGAIGPISEAQRSNLQLISSSANYLNRLVNDILDFSRVRNRKVDLYFSKFSLAEVIGTVVSLLKVLSEDKRIEIETSIDTLPLVVADKNRIQQVLINILGNAIKFTDTGKIKIIAKKEVQHVLVKIVDTGVGIPRDQLNRIWNPFEQAADVDTREYGGAGLGLAISKEIIEMHNGSIWVESEKGKGSVFSLTIPLIQKEGGVYRETLTTPVEKKINYFNVDNVKSFPEIKSTDAPVAKLKTKGTILAVDDDVTNLQVILNICSPLGYKVKTAKDGHEALDLIDQEPPDLILLDLMLPGMSGYEVCERIKDYGEELFIPVIMLTARNQLQDLVKGFNSGANDYLTKPFNRQELLVRIGNQLAIKNMHETEKALRNTLNKYKHIVSSSGEQMCFFNINLEIEAINEAFSTTLHLESGEILGRSLADLEKTNGDFWKTIREFGEKCLVGQEIHSLVWYYYPTAGRVPLDVSMYPFIEKNGECAGVVFVSRNVTTQIQLEMELLNVSERERRQIGMELHDGLSHTLLGIAIASKVLSEKLEEKSLPEVQDVLLIEKNINKAIEATRGLARGLFPVSLENASLAVILDEFKENLKKSKDIACKIEVDKSISSDKLKIPTQLYYLIQEAGRNIVKHSGATHAFVQILLEDHNFMKLTIENDGASLQDNQKKKQKDIKSGGMGLHMMQYRARMIGGILNIENREGGGVRVICRFKLNPKD